MFDNMPKGSYMLCSKINMKTIKLDDHRDVWIATDCLCVSCSHLWSAVVHKDRQSNLECPECGEMKGAVIRYINKD